MEKSAAVLGSRTVAEAAGLSGAALTARLYRQTQRQVETAGHTHDEGPGDASPLRTGAGADRREPRRSQLVWVSPLPQHA